MKKKENPAWITSDMVAQGITITALDYILGNKKSLNVGTLSVNELLLIRSVVGESFEQTEAFIEWIKPFKAVGKKYISEELLEVVSATTADQLVAVLQWRYL
jgi:hypothetical protein